MSKSTSAVANAIAAAKRFAAANAIAPANVAVKPYYSEFHTINATNNEVFFGYFHTVTGHIYYEECLTRETLQDSFPSNRIVLDYFQKLPA